MPYQPRISHKQMERNNRPTPTILIELVGTSTRTPVFVSIFPWKKTWKAMGKAVSPRFSQSDRKKTPRAQALLVEESHGSFSQ